MPKCRRVQIAAIPAIMVKGRLRVGIATPSAMAPAIHSWRPPLARITETNETIRHPGKAFKARAQAPSVGNPWPITTPSKRTESVPAARTRMIRVGSVVISVMGANRGDGGADQPANDYCPGSGDGFGHHQGGDADGRYGPG